jgi:hypothetical protein
MGKNIAGSWEQVSSQCQQAPEGRLAGEGHCWQMKNTSSRKCQSSAILYIKFLQRVYLNNNKLPSHGSSIHWNWNYQRSGSWTKPVQLSLTLSGEEGSIKLKSEGRQPTSSLIFPGRFQNIGFIATVTNCAHPSPSSLLALLLSFPQKLLLFDHGVRDWCSAPLWCKVITQKQNCTGGVWTQGLVIVSSQPQKWHRFVWDWPHTG